MIERGEQGMQTAEMGLPDGVGDAEEQLGAEAGIMSSMSY